MIKTVRNCKYPVGEKVKRHPQQQSRSEPSSTKLIIDQINQPIKTQRGMTPTNQKRAHTGA